MIVNFIGFKIFIFISCLECCLSSCFYDNSSFAEGESWNSSCHVCRCHSGEALCTKIACPAVSCKTEVLSLPPNECCPQCLPYKRHCVHNSATYLHDDVWSSNSKCTFYHCQDGSSLPFIIQCPSLVCSKGQKLLTEPGKCCPHCVSSKCNEQNQDKDDGISSSCFQNINLTRPCEHTTSLRESPTVIWKNSCAFCVTENGSTDCYARQCPICANLSNPNYLSDSCCSCSLENCGKDCLKCSQNDPNHCIYCKDLTKVIHKGKCIKECPKGLYRDDNMHCQSCPPPCKTCFGNMNSQCSSCKNGYLLQKGHCVEKCDLKFFESQGLCLECHKSCSSCVGSSEEDCISCSLSGQLLQDGKCVDHCEGHFYISTGYCLSCNESCARCLKDGTCQFCEQGFYLEEGFCLPECSPGYYALLNAYCLACHDECQECFGPLAYHCKSCPFGQFLLQNSCVWDCGQGYFGDLGAGICRPCHPKCRACLGGSSDDKCLSCSSGYLLPYVGTHFGICVEKCPDQYYLMESGVCGMCYETCERCFGPNDTECTSCNNTLYFKQGGCVPHCSTGFFQEGGVCYACHPSCATCYGFIENECFTCPLGRTLKYGKCVSLCEEGKYMNLDGQCLDCHPSCSDCILSADDKTTQCIKCKNQQQSILKNECIQECSSNFYMNSYHTCKDCNPTCATCEREGATSCASCWNGNFLTHLGTCEAQCHHGYFPSQGICEACSPDCHDCISASECLHCKGDLVLQSGVCVSQCSEQHYIDTVTRQCKACSEQCYSCRGPLPSDCSSCKPGKLFQDAICVQYCSDGFYRDGNMCRTCDLKCQTCSSLNKCTSCDLPLFLLKDECVDDCGVGFYPDFETLTCKACSHGCVSCASSSECNLCATGYYHLDFSCVTYCPYEYYADHVWRVCKKNVDIPSLNTNSILKFQSGRRILIAASFLSATDQDSDSLEILVSHLPTNGILLKMSEKGKELKLNVGENFTSTELQNGWIFFQHLKGIPLSGDLILKISDGHLSGNEIILPLQVSSAFPPTIKHISNIIVNEDSLVVFNSSFLSVQDPDNLEDVILHVIQGPCFGKLVLLPEEREINTVSYKEFQQNKVALRTFQKSLLHSDKLILLISDGFNSLIAEIQIFILPKEVQLLVVHNRPILVRLNEMAKLTDEHVLVVGEGLQPNEIVFKIEKASVSPFGNFFKNMNYLKLKKQKLSAEKIIFTQEEISQGLIFYKHSENTSSKFMMNIEVMNTTSSAILNFDFEIHLLQDDNIVLPEEPVQFGMMVLQNHPATITSDRLQMQLNNIPANDIVYRITKKLLKDEGFLESLDNPGHQLQTFTQQDIDDMKIVYHPPPYAEAYETHFFFQFIVLHAERGIQLSPVQNFTITLRPQSSEFTSPSTSIDYETTIMVHQGQTVDLGPNWLSTVGHEVPDDQLEVVLNIAPQHGVLMHKQNDIEIEIMEDDGFSFTSIINDAYYVHDGSDKFKDYAVFKIMGGPYTSLNKINFIISPNDRESPVILDSTVLMGTVTEGEFLNVQRRHLAYTDLVSGDHDIIFTITVEPKYGKLEKKINYEYQLLRYGDTFTQQDINEALIRYAANSGIGDETIRDSLHFDVSDGSGNIQANQVLTMKIKPKVRHPPVVKVNSDVKVLEGGQAIIQPEVMTVFDPDSPLSDLIAFIEKQPDYGFLENSRPIPGAEKTLDGIPISSFSYIDLVEGYIKYIQISHRGVEPERDTVYIRISDGHLSSSANLVNITIKPINDEAPHVETHPLLLLQGSFAKILNSTLAVSDEDTSVEHLYISLNNLPLQGVIKQMESNNYNFKDSKSLSLQDTFTFQDILNGLIIYVHDNSKSAENESISVSVTDGHHTVSAAINVLIVVKDREVPYLVRNLGLEIIPGESSVIGNKVLSANDSDSPVHLLRYTMTTNPSTGELFLIQNGKMEKLLSDSQNTGFSIFTQDDVDQGRLLYRHNIGDPIGVHYFKFTVTDPANNVLLDQKFFISVSEDVFPPIIIRNTGLEVEEKHSSCINSSMLAAIDEHERSKDLVFTLSSLPSYGYLEMKYDRGKPVSSFLMSHLNVGQICYAHKSDIYSPVDSYSFTVSDGKNDIIQTFLINITYKDNILPVVKVIPLTIQEGSQKTITEFEIDIFDRDSLDKDVIIKVISSPHHGTLIHSSGTPVNQFSVESVKYNQISYIHDDSDTTMDNFTFVVSDGLNREFVFIDGKNITTQEPIGFPIIIFPVDDAVPVLIRNKGLQVLKKDYGKVWNIISENILYTKDADTDNENIIYRITLQPHFGYLELTNNPDVKLFNFSQNDIMSGKLQYVLKHDDMTSVEDHFMFSIEDTKPNKIFNNIFSIRWTRILFSASNYSVSETEGLLEVAVKRIGNKNVDFTVQCEIERVNLLQKVDSGLIAVVDEVHFRENDDVKFCLFKIVDNSEYERKKQYKAILKSGFSLLGYPHIARISVVDEEDEPVIRFKENVFRVNETGQYYNFTVIREGDLTQELSILCTTSDGTARGSNASSLLSGSDYRTRDSSYGSIITFEPSVTEAMCVVKIIDDNIYEEEEDFFLNLSNPHPIGKIQNDTKARVIIQGPNDVPYVFLQKLDEAYLEEVNASVVILRQGVDLTQRCTVWCGSLSSTDMAKELLNSYHQITLHPFETSAVCSVKGDKNKEKISDFDPTINVFLDSPDGCILSEPSRMSIAVKKAMIFPVVEFRTNHVIVQENAGSIHIPVLRTGDVSSSATLYCITQDGTAHAKEDYEQRHKTRKSSLIHFNPGQKELFCTINIYDDHTYEGKESFQVLLLPLANENEMVTLGNEKSVAIEITDPEDVTVIELEKPHYLVGQSSFPNSSTLAVLSVIRHGDTALASKIRISTIDGSASSGLDYYAKSKLFSFPPGEKKKNFEIEILYNKRRNWALSLTVILGPDEVVNAEIGNISKAVVTIPRVESVESLILPAVPVVVSLIHYDDVKKGMNQDAISGYPLICVTPCDINYPDYAATRILCQETRINVSSMSYSWEVAMPLNSQYSMSPFEKITDSTLFTSAYNKVLDSIYFRPHEKVRCIAQPKDARGHLGIPLRSRAIKISAESGFCLTPNKMKYSSSGVSSQPFLASLQYLNSSDASHPNKIHIHVEIPHEDGLLPLMSTYPLHNIEYLLTQNIYRQQHVCSNLLQKSSLDKSFLKSFNSHQNEIKKAFPYHSKHIPKEMQLIYQHLELKKCKWSFNAWYSMSDLVELCGGTVVPDFKVRDTDSTYISVLLPFYVTYIFAAAPTGWVSVEHRTEIEFSFFYDTFLWKTGSHTDGTLNALLNIIRIGTDSSGHVFFEFKTTAKFYGCFVLEHHTLPGIKSHLTAPDSLDIKFNLELLWSEQTFDGPMQLWKASSNYNLKDYSGHYTVHLIPCEVLPAEQFSIYSGQLFLPCIAKVPQKFDLPITFQQTLRPKPVVYALETFFQLFNDENLFLLNPFQNLPNFQYLEYKGSFSKGDNVYGRVFWSPEQQLEPVYELKIKEVLLCTGKNGFVPVYDPKGNTYGKGPQYGCLVPNLNLKHKFVLLNKYNMDQIDAAFQGISFDAKFIDNVEEYSQLSQISGVDGFVFKTDPLYEVSSSQQWFLQVSYSIKTSHKFRNRRSLGIAENLLTKEENITNIKMIFLKKNRIFQSSLHLSSKGSNGTEFGAHHIMYIISIVLILLGIIIARYKKHDEQQTFFRKYSTWMNLTSKKSSNKCYEVVECKQKIKQTEKCKIKIYSPIKELAYITEDSSETEV